MRWDDERYIRVYTRDTAEWLALGWEAQALFMFLLRVADRAGIVPTGRAGVRGLAGLTRMPLEVVERATPILLEDGCLRVGDGCYVIPNFIAAQEAATSDAQRKRDQRERDRAKAMANGAKGSKSGLDAESQVTRQDSPGVTSCGHAVESRHGVTKDGHMVTVDRHTGKVTPSLAVPCRAEPSHAVSSASQVAASAADAVEDLPDATADAVEVPHRPTLELLPCPPNAPSAIAAFVAQAPLLPEAVATPHAKPKRTPAAKREPTGDSRHAPLVLALVEAHREAKGAPYGFQGGKDARAVSDLLALADQNPATHGEAAPSEILRRWGIALRWRGFPACTGLLAFRDNWNAYIREHDAKQAGDRPRLGPAPEAKPAPTGDRPRL